MQKEQIMTVPKTVEGSWDEILHELNHSNDTLLVFRDIDGRESTRRGQRPIGVVYHPEYEAYGNYVPSNLEKRYDAFVYLDRTQALHPLHLPEIKDLDLPETFPSGL